MSEDENAVRLLSVNHAPIASLCGGAKCTPQITSGARIIPYTWLKASFGLDHVVITGGSPESSTANTRGERTEKNFDSGRVAEEANLEA